MSSVRDKKGHKEFFYLGISSSIVTSHKMRLVILLFGYVTWVLKERSWRSPFEVRLEELDVVSGRFEHTVRQSSFLSFEECSTDRILGDELNALHIRAHHLGLLV
jgi:hypothetical protein